MSKPLEDYAFLSDTETAALVARDGSVDWMCLPRFDSPACFAALLGDRRHGFFRIAPVEEPTAVRRRYRSGTLVLETEYDTPSGTVRVIDGMPPRHEHPTLLRLVEGVRGSVPMSVELRLRFDYGRVVPWVTRTPGGLRAIAGPDAVQVYTPVELTGRDLTTTADFTATQGSRTPFTMAWYAAHDRPPLPMDAAAGIALTTARWQEWATGCSATGRYAGDVTSSLTVLKGLIYQPTGGIVAAATTSLPENPGGERNWDYRYTWLRDASMTVAALARNGFLTEARDFRDWFLRAVAGDPAMLQIMYGIAGERRLPETTLDWLPGYENSRPVRIGNGAAEQFQLDVYGELLGMTATARNHGLPPSHHAWSLQQTVLDFLEGNWHRPDEGIWETRGGRQHFVHSKVMAWAAFDRAADAVTRHGLPGDAGRWRAIASEIHREICRQGFDDERGVFTQSYGSAALDAALLLMPRLGFLPPDDPRIRATVLAIERELADGPLVHRYSTADAGGLDDGLSGGEGAFLICSFWLVDALALIGQRDRAEHLFGRLLGLRNDVGLLAEEYDPHSRRLVGNFPQAFSHIGLVNSADTLAGDISAAIVDPTARESSH